MNYQFSSPLFCGSLLRSLFISRRNNVCFNYKLVHVDVCFHAFDERLRTYAFASRKQTIDRSNFQRDKAAIVVHKKN